MNADKCKHCGKPEFEHTVGKRECPQGRKHRSIGYTQFGPTTFEPKASQDNGKGGE